MALGENTDLNPQNGIQGSSRLYKFGTSPNTRSVVTQKVRVLAPAYGADTPGLFQIGVLSNFGPTESRSIEPVRGIGFGDIIAELVPGNTEPMTASVERTMLYLSNLWQSTGYASGVSGPVRSLRHHRWPFDVKQEIVFSTLADHNVVGSTGDGTFEKNKFSTDGGSIKSLKYTGSLGGGGKYGNDTVANSHQILVTYYEGCWWGDWNTSYQKDTAMVMESGTMTITDVHDFSEVTYGEFLATGNDPSLDQFSSQIYDPSTFTT
jgi:hypothetical protein